MQGKSPPVQVQELYSNLDMVNYRLLSCNSKYTKYIPAYDGYNGSIEALYRDR